MNGSHLFSVVRKLRKQPQTLTQRGNLFSPDLKADIQTKATKLLANTYNIVCSPQSRMLFTVAVMILICASESFGFQTASKDLKTVVKDFQKFLYDDVRFAVCIIGFALGAIGLIFSKNPDTRKQALFAIGGAAFFAFGPGFLNFIAEITGTTKAQ
jgi:TrbC/VIRB2 pilin